MRKTIPGNEFETPSRATPEEAHAAKKQIALSRVYQMVIDQNGVGGGDVLPSAATVAKLEVEERALDTRLRDVRKLIQETKRESEAVASASKAAAEAAAAEVAAAGAESDDDGDS